MAKSKPEKKQFLPNDERFKLQTELANNREMYEKMTLGQAFAYLAEKFKFPKLTKGNLVGAAGGPGVTFLPRSEVKAADAASTEAAQLRARVERLEKFCVKQGMALPNDPGLFDANEMGQADALCAKGGGS